MSEESQIFREVRKQLKNKKKDDDEVKKKDIKKNENYDPKGSCYSVEKISCPEDDFPTEGQIFVSEIGRPHIFGTWYIPHESTQSTLTDMVTGQVIMQWENQQLSASKRWLDENNFKLLTGSYEITLFYDSSCVG